MKAVNVDDVLKILFEYGRYIFVGDEKRYSSMVDEVANLKALKQQPCEDCISRQAAIDAADRADYTGLAVEDVKKVTDEVVKELKQLPSVQPKQQWIPCSEREPAESGNYWITWTCKWTSGQTVALLDTGEYNIDSKKWYHTEFSTEPMDLYGDTKVIAWMPPPEPYKEESEE